MLALIACEFAAVLVSLFLINLRLDCISNLINLLLEKNKEKDNERTNR
jgi:hypothetical protein